MTGVQTCALPIFPFDVSLYRGNPEYGGALLGSKTVSSLASAAPASLSFDWDPANSNGSTPIYAWLDSSGAVAEANENDNKAFRYYSVGLGQPIELHVLRTEVSQTPDPGEAKGVIRLSIPVHNDGAFDANAVELQVSSHNGRSEEHTSELQSH